MTEQSRGPVVSAGTGGLAACPHEIERLTRRDARTTSLSIRSPSSAETISARLCARAFESLAHPRRGASHWQSRVLTRLLKSHAWFEFAGR